ncbi:MAG: hypothetical protein SGPRY_011840 [Prymnesium sp.]
MARVFCALLAVRWICACSAALLGAPHSSTHLLRRCPPALPCATTCPAAARATVPHSLRMVATLAPQEMEGGEGILKRAVRTIRRLLARVVLFVRSLFGSLFSEQPPTSDNIFSRDDVAKMRVMRGTATRSFATPDEAYLYFDYTFTPFFSALPANSTLKGRAANSTVRWLQWADAQRVSELEIASDATRLAFLRSILEEARDIEKENRRRQLLSPIWSWFQSDTPARQRALPELPRRPTST